MNLREVLLSLLRVAYVYEEHDPTATHPLGQVAFLIRAISPQGFARVARGFDPRRAPSPPQTPIAEMIHGRARCGRKRPRYSCERLRREARPNSFIRGFIRGRQSREWGQG